MFREADKYWGRDYYRRVPYRVVMVNPEVERYLREVCGGRKKFLDEVAACVSVKPTGVVGYSHPTGGRVRAIELPVPFIDQATGEKCLEADVKGVLFTSSGFEGFRYKLIPGQGRREMCAAKGGEDYVYGPVNLKEPTGDFETVMHLRNDGYQTHVPGVVLELSKLVYEGELIDPAEVRRMFGMPENYRFGIYVRFFPGSTSTRVADFLGCIDLPGVIDERGYEKEIADILVELPGDVGAETRGDHEIWTGGTIVYRRELIESVREGRRRWQEVELPRLARVLGRKEGVVARKYYDWLIKRVVHAIVVMANAGVVPHSGKEGPVEEGEINVRHTHLQNKSVTGLDLEWAPATVVENVPSENRSECWDEVLLGYHEMLIAMGLVALEDYDRIPSFGGLTGRILESADLIECPDSLAGAIADHRWHRGREGSPVRRIRKQARTDRFLREITGREICGSG